LRLNNKQGQIDRVSVSKRWHPSSFWERIGAVINPTKMTFRNRTRIFLPALVLAALALFLLGSAAIAQKLQEMPPPPPPPELLPPPPPPPPPPAVSNDVENPESKGASG
ncbi:MAG TPA: hypothetical protein VI029_05330, partial [Mycobacterium sp.]